MKRVDTRKKGGYEANYNAGWVTTDESTTELTGTVAEAQVIVWALECLVLERQRMNKLGVQLPNPFSRSGGPYYRTQHASPEEVLTSIINPEYAAPE